MSNTKNNISEYKQRLSGIKPPQQLI